MIKHEKADLILKYMSENKGDIPRPPDVILKRSKLDIDYTEFFMITKMMFNDGFLYEHESKGIMTGSYGVTYKGILFLEKGGYSFEHKMYLLQLKSTNISNNVDVYLKPLGIITALLIIIWNIIQVTEYLSKNLIKFFLIE